MPRRVCVRDDARRCRTAAGLPFATAHRGWEPALALRWRVDLAAVGMLLLGRRKPRIKPRVVAPDVAIELFLARAGEYAAHLAGRNFLHRAHLGSDPLQLGGLLQRKCRDGG